MTERTVLSREKNPSFEHCEAEYWLALHDGKVVGRIAGIVNAKANQIWKQKYARFGWIDFIDDHEVSAKLLQTVEQWARAKDMSAIHGPLGFTVMDGEGMIVDGFDEIGTAAEPYNAPYYPVHLEKHGYVKDAEWLQSLVYAPEKLPDKLVKFSRLVARRYSLRPLKARKAKELLPYAHKVFITLNEAFEGLYGFAPLSDKQIAHYTRQYFSYVDPDYVCLVLDKNDDVVGCGIGIPSLSKALIKARGKLFPFGFLHCYRALRKNDTVEFCLIGVRPDYQKKGVHAIIYHNIMKACLENNIGKAYVNPQLSDNTQALILWKAYDTRHYITRRCYIKDV